MTCFTLGMDGGMQVEVLDYGAIVRCLYVPNRTARLIDVALGYDDIAGYEKDRSYIGAAIGRYANRIRGGTFTLDGTEYHLTTKEGPHHLHGGGQGFDKVLWQSRLFDEGDTAGVVLEHMSPDGDQGYPGNLSVQITYGLSSANVFSIDYRAASDRASPVNLTHHGYFNLSGAGNGDVLDHELTIYADTFLEIDDELLPTGRFVPVEGTPFDFLQGERIGARIHEDREQLRVAGGYDHNFVLAHAPGDLSRAARVFNQETGVELQVLTTEPGLQFYSGNSLSTVRSGKKGNPYRRWEGFCLEPQHFPDSPNHPEFPSTILHAGDELRSRTEYRFSAR